MLFVCTANICRSPTAEAVLRRMLEAKGVGERYKLDSAGTHDYHLGQPPHPLAVERAKLRGYELAHLVSRRVRGDDFEHFDLILAMDTAHISTLRKIVPTVHKQKIELFLEYGNTYHGKGIPDPYGGDAAAFDLMLDMIEDGCAGLAGVLGR